MWLTQGVVVCLLYLLCGVGGSSDNGVVKFIQKVSVDKAAPPKPQGQCIWYGQCGTDAVSGKALNCRYNGPAKPLPDESLGTLREYCPGVYNMTAHTESAVKTCCSKEQLNTLVVNMTIPKHKEQLNTLVVNMAIPKQSLSRCPACYRNFLDLYCYFTCAPYHSEYLAETLNQTEPGKNESVQGVTYAVSQDFAHGMFNSCKDVVMPSNNEKALSILCGRTADTCTPENWLKYMGDQTLNTLVPFPINFTISSVPVNVTTSFGEQEVLVPMNVKVAPCNESCSCQDCQASCGVPLPPVVPPPPWTILGMDGLAFIMWCVYSAFVLAFGTYLAWNTLGYIGSQEELLGHIPSVMALNTDMLYAENTKNTCCGCFSKLGMYMEMGMERMFSAWGLFCARCPFVVIALGLAVCAGCSAGLVKFQVMTDPVELWSSPENRARLEKDYFDDKFTPFYRTEQLIITTKNSSQFSKPDLGQATTSRMWGPVLRMDVLQEVLRIQNHIEFNISGRSDKLNRTVSLQDICFMPLSPDNRNCTINSVLQYYQNNKTQMTNQTWDQYHFYVEADYSSHFSLCTRNPTALDDTSKSHFPCLAKYGGPSSPWVVLGGYPGDNYENATALVITFTVNNYKNDTFQEMAETWEKAYLHFISNYSTNNPNSLLKISFSAERSIQDELNRESRSDVKTIVISYCVMFIYVSLALGQYHSLSLKALLVDSKICLGFAGVLIVMLSVSSALGTYSYFGMPATLIIIEVIPFLVLAVGVDNIFILVQAYQRSDRGEGVTLEEQMGIIVGRVGPSMMLTSFSESLAFFIGAVMTNMPAVKVFAFYAALAVLFDFLLQISIFVSLLTLDAKRQEAKRPEFLCCVKVNVSVEKTEDFLYMLVKNFYSRFLLHKYVRPVVMFVFIGWACACVSLVNKIDVGLDQKLAMPKDSYVLTYFNNMTAYLSVGPPVYFVVQDGHNYTGIDGQNQVCGGKGCPEESLLGQVYKQSQQAESTKIAHPPSSWLDDYFDWIGSCCRQYQNRTHCKQSVPHSDKNCSACNATMLQGRVVGEDFLHYLPWFLEENPGIQCPKGGHAAYGSAVNLLNTTNTTDRRVGATYFMTYHTVLKTSADYVSALRNAREMSDHITYTILHWRETHNQSLLASTRPAPALTEKVFAYSVFYVFYEQYLTIVHLTWVTLTASMGAILLMSFLLLGLDLWSALVIVFTIAMIMASMFGLMVMWSISLNAISLVNLVMTVGISVEFCSHIVRAFVVSPKTSRLARAHHALSNMGSSVLSGITLTKLGGIIVLAFSKSQLFKVFYFRMYLGIVIFGATHGLIFLPVFLSYVGPPVDRYKVRQHRRRQYNLKTDKPGVTSVDYSTADTDPILGTHHPAHDILVREASAPTLDQIVPRVEHASHAAKAYTGPQHM